MRFATLKFLPLNLLFATLLLFRSRTFAEAESVDWSTLHRVVALPAAVLFSFGYFVLRGHTRRWPWALRFFAAYIVVGMLSALMAPFSMYAWWKLAELVMVLSVGLYVARRTEGDPEFATEAWELWLRFMSLLVVVTLLGAALLPGDAFRAPVSEMTAERYGDPLVPVQLYGSLLIVNPNSLGAIAAILVYVNLARLKARGEATRALQLIWVAALFAVLVLAQSRTAWTGLSVAALVGVWSSRRTAWTAKLGALTFLGAALFFAFDTVRAYVTRGMSLDGMASLTGRAAWWTLALERFQEADPMRQIFGLGFMTANRWLLSRWFDSDAASLHSDYVDALISAGGLGFVLLILTIASTARAAAQSDAARRGEALGVACILVVRSVTGTTFAIHNLFLPVVFLLPALALAGRSSRRGAPGPPPGGKAGCAAA